MKNICIVAVSAVLVLALGGCESRYDKIADTLKSQGWRCDKLTIDKIVLMGNKASFPYAEDIVKMNRSEYNKFMKSVGCNSKEYFVEAKLEKEKGKLAELEAELAVELAKKYSYPRYIRASIKETQSLIEGLEYWQNNKTARIEDTQKLIETTSSRE